VTDTPGLYFLGLTWQHTRGSALLGWVKADAEFVTTQVAARADGAEGSSRTAREHETRRAVPASYGSVKT
jgi:putative flavoprotein involved in K+ transport